MICLRLLSWQVVELKFKPKNPDCKTKCFTWWPLDDLDSEIAVLHISTFVFLFQQFQSPLIPFL